MDGWLDGALPFISSKSNLIDPRTLHDTTLDKNTALCDPSLPDKHDRLVCLSQSRQMKKKAGRGQNCQTSIMLQQRGTEKASFIFQMFSHHEHWCLFHLLLLTVQKFIGLCQRMLQHIHLAKFKWVMFTYFSNQRVHYITKMIGNMKVVVFE